MTAGTPASKGAAKKRGLGRGLEALLGPKAAAEAPALQQAMPGDQLRTLPVDAMVPGKFQPRRTMDDAKLEELSASIRAQGVIQPIVVREHVGADGKGGRTYEIIAGERRWRASQRAGLAEVPVVVRVVDDRTVVAMALIENIQREDLNPLEEAQGVQRLIAEFGLTHDAAAQAIGRSRSAASNLLRLLNLTEPVQTMLMAGDIDMGHARALLALDGAAQITAANQVSAKKLSVREAESLVKKLSAEFNLTAPRKPAAGADKSGDVRRVEEELSDLLTAQVEVRVKKRARGAQAGEVAIQFGSLDELNGLIERLRASGG